MARIQELKEKPVAEFTDEDYQTFTKYTTFLKNYRDPDLIREAAEPHSNTARIPGNVPHPRPNPLTDPMPPDLDELLATMSRQIE